MIRPALCLAALGVAFPASAQEAALRAAVKPSPVVLGQSSSVVITVKGLKGTGELRSAVNVGQVSRVEGSGDLVRLHYRPPDSDAPQMLCLILWRQGLGETPVVHLRVPLLARVDLSVRARPRATVRAVVGDRSFAAAGRVNGNEVVVPVLVSPGVTQAVVEIAESGRPAITKLVRIQQQPYNRLALAVAPTRDKEGVPRFRVTVMTAEGGRPRVWTPDGELAVARLAGGVWSGYWSPRRRMPGGSMEVRAWLPRPARSVQVVEVGLDAFRPPTGAGGTARPGGRPGGAGLNGEVGVVLGMLHNFGELASLRLGLDAGIDYPVLSGRLGARLFTSFSWGSQSIPASYGLEGGESRVSLTPIGIGITYSMPWPLTPYVLAGCIAQIVRTSNQVGNLPPLQRHDVVFGALGLVGIGYRLGPGRVVFEIGGQYSRLANVDIELQAGGLVMEGGYRLAL